MISINEEELHVDGDLVHCMAETLLVVKAIATAIWKMADENSKDAITHDMGVWVEQIIDAAWEPSLK